MVLALFWIHALSIREQQRLKQGQNVLSYKLNSFAFRAEDKTATPSIRNNAAIIVIAKMNGIQLVGDALHRPIKRSVSSLISQPIHNIKVSSTDYDPQNADRNMKLEAVIPKSVMKYNIPERVPYDRSVSKKISFIIKFAIVTWITLLYLCEYKYVQS